MEPYDNPNAIGNIMVFVNVGWYDPQVYLTDTGDLFITSVETDEGTAYELKDSQNNLITRVGAFRELVAGKIRSGLIETQELITETLIAKNIVSEERIISPLAEFEELKADKIETEEISSKGQDLTIRLGDKSEGNEGEENGFGRLLVKGIGGETVTSINAAGNATFAGQIKADSLETKEIQVDNNATISGTLYADRIVAKEGGFGELLAQNLSMESIKSIVREEIDNTGEEEILNQVQDDGEEEEEEFDLEALLAEVEEWTGTSTQNDLPIDCLEEDTDNTSPLCLIDTDLTVLGGHTSLSDTSIAGQLSVGSLIISDNSIDTLSDTLYIQQLAMGGLDILAGKVTIDIDGNVFIAEHLTVEGELIASNIRPKEGEDLTINLGDGEKEGEEQETGFGKLLIKGIKGETVASIDGLGKINADSLQVKTINTDLLRINTDANEANESGVIIAAADNFEKIGILAPGIETNATAGTAILPADETEIIIYNDKLNDQSLIYLTPTSDTQNKILYVKTKHTDEIDRYFIVGINGALTVPVEFNWWIIN